jgi:hypothetical protein
MDLENLQKLTEEFLYYFAEKSGLKEEQIPQVNFVMDESYATDPFGMTGYYDPSSSQIYAFVPGRHIKDVMRTVAHECIHHMQNLRGDLNNMGEMGEGYAQKNEHMRNMEKEAYLEGSISFRDWTDFKKEQGMQKETIRESKTIDFDSRNKRIFEKLKTMWTKKK